MFLLYLLLVPIAFLTIVIFGCLIVELISGFVEMIFHPLPPLEQYITIKPLSKDEVGMLIAAIELALSKKNYFAKDCEMFLVNLNNELRKKF